ncbi:MAG: hypothetical protein DHS20C01_30680 [marine bacterium B5-7]|nr:MAG: hypothetical protein DHS20C01_30680 [marine bacterium B5-7]
MLRNEPKLETGSARTLHPVNDAKGNRGQYSTSRPQDNAYAGDQVGNRKALKDGCRIVADLETELVRSGLDPDLIDTNVVLLSRRLFLFPRIHMNDDEHRYMRRVRLRSALMTMWVLFITLLLTVAIISMVFTSNKLFFEPRQAVIERQNLGAMLDRIIDNSHVNIDPVDPHVPDWLWSKLQPDWYVEDAIYTRGLNPGREDIDLITYLREKKAVVVREIEPAYSNDKIQNRLRDPDIIYFGSNYDRAYRRFVNMTLAIVAIAREENSNPGLDSIYTSTRRAELVKLITSPKPPEPNAYYDSRVAALVESLRRDTPLVGDSNGVISTEAAHRDSMITLLDDLSSTVSENKLDTLAVEGLGPLLKYLPYGWGSSEISRAFYNEKRERFVKWNMLELRLLMLDLIYGAEFLPQELTLENLYLYHLGGEAFQKRYVDIDGKRLLPDATRWITNDYSDEGNPVTREKRFIEEFANSDKINVGDDSTERRIALSLVYKTALFHYYYALIDDAADVLESRPFLGKLGLPIASFDVDDIKPWGLYQARRNGHAHEGLDIGGDLGAPALAVMDGTITLAGYQQSGAGNYLILKRDNIEVTYMHLLRMPTTSQYQSLLTRGELAAVGNDLRQGYNLAMRKYASIILNKPIDSLSEEELSREYLRKHSPFGRIRSELAAGRTVKVRKGDTIANVGLSGNVTLNSARHEMIYPHIHLEVNDGRIDPMQVIEGIGSRWPEIREHHLRDPFYSKWLKQSNNWNWYSKFYPSGAVTTGGDS